MRAIIAVAYTALVCAGLASATPAFHNTEAVALSAWLTERGSTTSIGSFTGRLTVVRGEAQAKLVWKLRVSASLRQPQSVTVHRGTPGALGPPLATLCAPCQRLDRGSTVFFTAHPWFRTGRTMASIPTLSVRVTTAPATRVITAELKRGGWRAFVS